MIFYGVCLTHAVPFFFNMNTKKYSFCFLVRKESLMGSDQQEDNNFITFVELFRLEQKNNEYLFFTQYCMNLGFHRGKKFQMCMGFQTFHFNTDRMEKSASQVQSSSSYDFCGTFQVFILERRMNNNLNCLFFTQKYCMDSYESHSVIFMIVCVSYNPFTFNT